MNPNPKLLFALLLATATLAAHHRTADYYDVTKPITLKGVVQKFIWANPHSFILLDVGNDRGVTETWAAEGDGPNNLDAGWDLRASGWQRTTLQPGYAISMTALPARTAVKLAGTIVIDEARMAPEVVAGMKKVAEAERAGRLVHGTDVTLPDGRKLLFGEAGR